MSSSKNVLMGFFLLSLAACGSGDSNKSSDAGTVVDGGLVVDASQEHADAMVDADVDTFAFRTESPDDYARVDRVAFPLSNQLLIASKDSYNAADPSDDVTGTFVGEILANLVAMHDALDDDLTGLLLNPCTALGDGTGSCIAVFAPLVLPDVQSIDVTSPPGFPNGRLLADPVVDVFLALLWLELFDGTHSATDLVGLNPTANDLAFAETFPYLAAPH